LLYIEQKYRLTIMDFCTNWI